MGRKVAVVEQSQRKWASRADWKDFAMGETDALMREEGTKKKQHKEPAHGLALPPQSCVRPSGCDATAKKTGGGRISGLIDRMEVWSSPSGCMFDPVRLLGWDAEDTHHSHDVTGRPCRRGLKACVWRRIRASVRRRFSPKFRRSATVGRISRRLRHQQGCQLKEAAEAFQILRRLQLTPGKNCHENSRKRNRMRKREGTE